MEKAQAQAEISPAVAMLVVILVLSMAIGMVLYCLQHNSVGIATPGSSLIRGRPISPLSRGATDPKSRPAPEVKEKAESQAASQSH